MQSSRSLSQTSQEARLHASARSRSGQPTASRSSGAVQRTQPADAQKHDRRPTSAILHSNRERQDGLMNSYTAAAGEMADNEEEDGSTAAELQSDVGTSASLLPSLNPLPTSLLSAVRRDYPAVFTALQLYDKALRHAKEKFSAKEAELRRCINVGEELLGQIDALKHRCEVLARERDEATGAHSAMLALHDSGDTSSQAREAHAAALRAAESAARAAAEEDKRHMTEAHHAQCVRFREQLQEALQEVSRLTLQQRDAESALQETRARLHRAEAQVVAVEEACAEREAATSAQHRAALQQQQLLFQRHLAQVQQQADVDKETVLAEATVELERLQRSLLRAEKELKEHQRTSERAVAIVSEPSTNATVEVMNLRRQLRQLEDDNHDLQLQLRRRYATHSAEGQTQGGSASPRPDGRLAEWGSDDRRDSQLRMDRNTSQSTNINAKAGASGNVELTTPQQALDVAASAPLLQRLQDENERLRRKLQDVARQAQDDVDKAHEARLAVQEELKSAEAQMQLLRTSVVSGLEQELQRTRAQLDAVEAHSRELQEVADAFEQRVLVLQREQQEAATQVESGRQAAQELQRQLHAERESKTALQAQLEQDRVNVQRKEALVVQLQREKQQLVVALRTLQGETVTIEEALRDVSAKYEAGNATFETNAARMQARCALLENELAELKDERSTLCSRLRDAEEAVEVLKDAQRISQDVVRSAQRSAKDAEEKERVSAEQHNVQTQLLKARATEAEQEGERLRGQLQEATRRLREQQESHLRKDEAARQNAEKVTALSAEVRQLHEAQSTQDDASRERWRQQYAQNAAERDRLLADKEQRIEQLQHQLHELDKAAKMRDEKASQLLRQRQQAQTALSEAVADGAAYKGRIQALEEELARVEAERHHAQEEARQLAEKVMRGDAAIAGVASISHDASAALRVGELEAQLTESEAARHRAERQRQQLQRSLLQLVLPSSSSTSPEGESPSASSALRSRDWEMFVQGLDNAVDSLRGSVVASSTTAAQADSHAASGASAPSSSLSAVPVVQLDACQRAVATTLRLIRDHVEVLHEQEEERWESLKNTVLSTLASQDGSENSHFALQSTPSHSSPALPAKGTLITPAELRERLATAFATLASTLTDLRSEWVEMRSRLTEAEHHTDEQEDLSARVKALTAAITESEATRAALQRSLDALNKKYAETTQKQTLLEAQHDQLQRELQDRDGRVADLERRLETRATEMQAERAAWTAKWQESQRHRDKEKSAREAEVAELRERLAATQDGASAEVENTRKASEAAQRQLRAQLLKVQESATSTEAALHQQVQALTQDKAHLTQGLRQVKTVVAVLEERVNAAEAALKSKEAEVAAAEAAVREMRRAHQQHLADGAAAGVYEQESLTGQVASLQAQLRTCRKEAEMTELTHAAERAELQALRKVNASLENRLAEVEEDRAPLRQQLHSLLSFAES